MFEIVRGRQPASEGRFTGRTVVITGASAGVGRATAKAFAREGARLALIARDEQGLEASRAEIESMGGQARIFPADVADAQAVLAAARECEKTLGPIDVWVNNAMATVFSPLESLRAEEIRRVTEVTYLGAVHGTMAALEGMRERNHGTIVQVGSSLAYRGIPLQAAYCGAKHAIRGFTDSLRCELIRSGSKVRISAVHLPAIDTPQFDWARTHRERLPRPVAPVYSTEVAAQAIVKAARDPVREYWLGGRTPLLILGNMLLPGWLDRFLAENAVEGQDRAEPVPEGRRDNLFEPVTGAHRTEGSFGEEAQSSAMLFRAPEVRVGTLAAVCLVTGLVAGAIGSALGAIRKGNRRWP
jgi:short-subunit dehydrogenase